jgi:hypothetical protein
MTWLSDLVAHNPRGSFDSSLLQDPNLEQELEALVETSFADDASADSPQALSSLFGGGFDNGLSTSLDSSLGAALGGVSDAADPSPFGGSAVLIGGLFGDRYEPGPQLDGALDDSRMPPVSQGDSNACGSSSLAMIMNYLGVPVTRQDIDREIRRIDQGLPPQPLIDYARDHGLEAEFYNHGSWDELKGFIDRGIPVQAQINTQADGSKTNMHWVAVVGFRTDTTTGEEQIGVRNSAKPYYGEVQWMSRAEFEKKWSHPLDGAGYDNSFIAYAPGGTDLPPSRWDGVEGLSAMNDGAWHIANSWDRIFDPDSFGSFVHGVIGLPGGVVQTIGGAFGYAIQTAGDWLDQKVGDVPVLGWVARPFGKVLDGLGAGIGNFFGGIGDGINCIGGAFEKLFDGDVGGFFGGLWNAGGKFVGGVFGAVGSVAGGFVNAAGSVFNTVADGAGAVVDAIGDGAKAVGDFFSDLF